MDSLCDFFQYEVEVLARSQYRILLNTIPSDAINDSLDIGLRVVSSFEDSASAIITRNGNNTVLTQRDSVQAVVCRERTVEQRYDFFTIIALIYRNTGQRQGAFTFAIMFIFQDEVSCFYSFDDSGTLFGQSWDRLSEVLLFVQDVLLRTGYGDLCSKNEVNTVLGRTGLVIDYHFVISDANIAECQVVVLAHDVSSNNGLDACADQHGEVLGHTEASSDDLCVNSAHGCSPYSSGRMFKRFWILRRCNYPRVL